MNNNYLIPANSKRSLLIFGMFKMFDLILFGSGLAITMLFLLFIPLTNLFFTIAALMPALIAGFLVLPFKNFVNVRTFLIEMYNFYTQRRIYVWKGWSIRNGKE